MDKKLLFKPRFKVDSWCFGKCLEEEKAQNPEGRHLGVLKIVFNSTHDCPDCGDMLYKSDNS